MHETDNLRIKGIQELISSQALLDELPVSEAASETVFNARSAIQKILHGEDDRLLVVVGPCSIHDVDAALGVGPPIDPNFMTVQGKMLVLFVCQNR